MPSDAVMPRAAQGTEEHVPPASAPGAEGARRVLSVLQAFSPRQHTLTARELAELTAIPLPSMYRYIALLREVGLIETHDLNGYRLSKRFIALARAAQQGEASLDRISLPIITGIRDRTDETVLIARRHR